MKRRMGVWKRILVCVCAAALLGGAASAVSRIIYTVVALAGIWCISLFFRDREELIEHKD